MTELLVGRQPILDRQKRTFAYELLFRAGATNRFDGSDGNAATSAVIANTFLTFGCERVLSAKRGFINFPRRLLLEDSGFLLPRDRVVIEILEDVEPDDLVLRACGRLKEAGYTIALDDVVDPSAVAPFLKYADLVKLDLPALGTHERQRICAYLQKKGVRLLAEKVETLNDFECALRDGCDLFQGYFFARPEIVKGQQIPVSKMTCLRLINETQRPVLNYAKLEQIVRLDIGLTRKLLCLVNSAAFGARNHIDAINQAFVRLGERNIRKWVTLAALPLLAAGRPAELISASLVRARFCELIAEYLGERAPSYFLTGLLSLLDAMIGRPLEEVVGEMALDTCIVDSVLGRSRAGDRMRLALELAIAFEKSDFQALEQLAAEAGISGPAAAELSVEAISWADSVPR